MDVPACLLALYEIFKYQLAGLTEHDLYKARNEFYYTLIAILNHPDNYECRNQWELRIWQDVSKGVRKFNNLLHVMV